MQAILTEPGRLATRVVVATALCTPFSSWAADSVNQAAEPANTGPLVFFSEYLRPVADWNGVRSKLEQAGLTFTFTYYGDAFANPVGGVTQGPGYDGRFGTIIDANLEKLADWSGATLHASIHQIHGTQFSSRNLDNLMTVSGIEAPPSTRLFNLWIEQKLANEVSLRVGQFTAAQVFEVSQNANLFINSTFGWPGLNAQDLPSGGPAYPEATPGVRLQFTPNDNLTFRAAVFDGDPAGPGTGNPVSRDPFGFAFRVNDPPFFVVESAYAYDQQPAAGRAENPNQEGYASPRAVVRSAETNLPGTVKVGAWLSTESFADQRLNAGGELLASGGQPLQHSGNFALYGVIDQMLWREPGDGDRGLSMYFRGSGAPSDRNQIDLYADGGLTYKGAIASRPDDTMGIGLAFARISPQASAFDRQLVALTGSAMPIRDFEAAIEWTYQWQLGNNWFIQPDLQYIIHPGGNIANPLDPTMQSAVQNALVFGTRISGRF